MSDNEVRPQDPKERETKCRVCGGNHEYGKATCNQWWRHRMPRNPSTAQMNRLREMESAMRDPKAAEALMRLRSPTFAKYYVDAGILTLCATFENWADHNMVNGHHTDSDWRRFRSVVSSELAAYLVEGDGHDA